MKVILLKAELFDRDNYVYASFFGLCAFCNLRYTAFCLEYCWESNIDETKKPNRDKICAKDSLFESLLNLLLYQFYYPMFTGGPVVSCDTFLSQVGTFFIHCCFSSTNLDCKQYYLRFLRWCW